MKSPISFRRAKVCNSHSAVNTEDEQVRFNIHLQNKIKKAASKSTRSPTSYCLNNNTSGWVAPAFIKSNGKKRTKTNIIYLLFCASRTNHRLEKGRGNPNRNVIVQTACCWRTCGFAWWLCCPRKTHHLKGKADSQIEDPGRGREGGGGVRITWYPKFVASQFGLLSSAVHRTEWWWLSGRLAWTVTYAYARGTFETFHYVIGVRRLAVCAHYDSIASSLIVRW